MGSIFGVEIFKDSGMNALYAQWASAIAVVYVAYIASNHHKKKRFSGARYQTKLLLLNNLCDICLFQGLQ